MKQILSLIATDAIVWKKLYEKGIVSMKSILVAPSLVALIACGSGGGFNDVSDNNFGAGSGTGTGIGGNGNEPGLVLDIGDGVRELRYAGDGSFGVFVTNADLTGNNPNQLDQIYSVNLSSGTVTQITQNADTESSAIKYRSLDISENGQSVIFVSSDDITGDNPSNLQNIFIASTSGSSVTQITDVPAGGYTSDIKFADQGNLISFISESDLTGDNSGNYMQVFTVDADGSNIFQVTSTSTNITLYDISDDGLWVVYRSTDDPLESNSDGGSELFKIGTDGANLSQVTDIPASDTPINLNKLEVSDDGSTAAFITSLELISGGNAGGFTQVYTINTDGSNLAQISNLQSDHFENHLSLSGDGQYVAFLSRGDITGDNPNGQDTIFWASFDGVNVVQLLRTDTVNASETSRDTGEFVFNNNGSTVFFESDENYAADAAGGEDKLYLASRQ